MATCRCKSSRCDRLIFYQVELQHHRLTKGNDEWQYPYNHRASLYILPILPRKLRRTLPTLQTRSTMSMDKLLLTVMRRGRALIFQTGSSPCYFNPNMNSKVTLYCKLGDNNIMIKPWRCHASIKYCKLVHEHEVPANLD